MVEANGKSLTSSGLFLATEYFWQDSKKSQRERGLGQADDEQRNGPHDSLPGGTEPFEISWMG